MFRERATTYVSLRPNKPEQAKSCERYSLFGQEAALYRPVSYLTRDSIASEECMCVCRCAYVCMCRYV